MAVRTITECDRCRREIIPAAEAVKVTIDGKKEICGPCKDKLDRFMSGEELEVPP